MTGNKFLKNYRLLFWRSFLLEIAAQGYIHMVFAVLYCMYIYVYMHACDMNGDGDFAPWARAQL